MWIDLHGHSSLSERWRVARSAWSSDRTLRLKNRASVALAVAVVVVIVVAVNSISRSSSVVLIIVVVL